MYIVRLAKLWPFLNFDPPCMHYFLGNYISLSTEYTICTLYPPTPSVYVLYTHPLTPSAYVLYSRPAQFFFGKNAQTPRWSLDQNMSAYQFLDPYDIVLPRPENFDVGHFKANIEIKRPTLMHSSRLPW